MTPRQRHKAKPTSDYPSIPALVALSDMPAIFGCKRQWVDQMRTKGILPEPDLYLGRTPGWIQERIEDWWQTNPYKSS